MKKRILLVIFAFILIIGMSYLFFHRAKNSEVQAISVSGSTVLQKEVTISAHASGHVLPYVSVQVKSRVDGELVSVGFKEGDFVKEGQIIFQIDPAPFKVALQQAEATLARDQAALDNYKLILSRYTPLTKKGYISVQDYDQANANVKEQKALILADEALLANAKLNLSYCTIHAPVSGRTGMLLVSQGTLVKATDTSPLVVINQISPVDIVFSIPEQELASIQKTVQLHKIPVTLKLKNKETSLQGLLSFMDNTVDTTTGMIQLKALYPNKSEELWPGMYVDVDIPLYLIHHALVIPTRAIQEGPEGTFVFVVNKDSKVNKQLVKTGPHIKAMTVVETGLTPGMKVVTEGQLQLVEGSPVTVRTLE